jgi:cytoskeletal protein RodZ
LIEYYKNDQLDDNLEPKLKVRKEEAGQKSSILPALLIPFFLSLLIAALVLATWQYWPEISEKFFNSNNVQQEDILDPYKSGQDTGTSDALLLPEPKVINDETSENTAVHSDETDVDNNNLQEVYSAPENTTDRDDLSSSQSRLEPSVNSDPSDGAMSEIIENGTTMLPEAVSKIAESQPQIENSELETEAISVQFVENSLLQTAEGSLLQAESSSQALNSSTGTMVNGNNAVPTLETKANQLLIQFSGDSWVSIKDADNTILSTGLMKSGKILSLDGKLPYKVFLGDARMATVRINGKVFDHSSYINKKNTARFKVE